MNLPLNGRVLVIDDNTDEGLPLIKVLSQHGVSVTYFTGNYEELPVHPFSDVRLVFLDIVLGPTGNGKNVTAPVENVLRKIIGVNNGPYILIGWTAHSEQIEEISKSLICKPILSLNLEKLDCKIENEDTSEEVKYSLEKIENKLKEELKKAGALHLFILWENLVRKATNQTVVEFSNFYDSETGDWNEKVSNVIHHLAEAHAGKQLKNCSINEIIRNGLMTFNGTFLDTLENLLRQKEFSQISTRFEKQSEISESIRAKINTKLHLIEDHNAQNVNTQPGSLYRSIQQNGNVHWTEIKFEEVFNGVLEKYPQKKDLIERLEHIALEVTPLCDFAQSKRRLGRLLPGVMWPIDHFSKIKKGDYIYSSVEFEIEDTVYILVFDFRYLTTIPLKSLERLKSSSRIKHELLVNIQSCLSRHMNRPGISSLNRPKKNKKK